MTVNFINSQERFQLGTEETFCNLDWYNPIDYVRGMYHIFFQGGGKNFYNVNLFKFFFQGGKKNIRFFF